MNSFTIRNATAADIGFVVQTIIASEKSGTSTLSYSTIFGLTEKETYDQLYKILEEDIDGCELSLSSFLIAEKEGTIAAAVCAWIEGRDAVSSTSIKGSLLALALPVEAIKKAAQISGIISPLHIEVQQGVLQIGLVYVVAEFRGNQLTELLIKEHVLRSKKSMETISEAHVQVFGNNLAAIRAYEKTGFRKVKEVKSTLPAVLDYLPGATKILMKMDI